MFLALLEKREFQFMKIKTLLFLHVILLLYSSSNIFSKLAGVQEFLSLQFFIYYGIVLLILFIYAILWQKVIKLLPLTTAFANKAVTVIWGIVFGMFIFGESLSLGKVIGSILIILGIIFYTKSSNLDEESRNE